MEIDIVNRSGFPLPAYGSKGASGIDLCASKSVTIKARDREVVGTGIYVKVPFGFEFQIRPRSGLAAKYGITVLNTPGTIDSDYRGEIKVILYNSARLFYHIQAGDRIAQAVLCPIYRILFNEVDSLEETERNVNGLGSTGR